MAVNVVSILNSRKHHTKNEINARLDAEQSLTRTKVRLKCPDRVKSNPVALKYWRDTIKRFTGIELLDDLDTDILAAYCLQSDIRDRLHDQYSEGLQELDILKAIQAQERLILTYANKLGITADSRARLAKRKAEESPKANKFSKFSGTG